MRSSVVLLSLGAAIALLVAAALLMLPPGQFGDLPRPETARYLACALLAGAAYAAAVFIVRRRAVSVQMILAILGIGLVARLLVLAAPPVLSTDIYRYVWDGRVQAAGINPYRHMPADPALAALRDADPARIPSAIYPNINRADSAVTIYPPAAQGLFALIGLTAPSIWTVKAVMLGFDLAATAAGLLLLRATARPQGQILVWAWNPLVIWEFAGGGHIDAAAVAFSALALLAAARLRPAWAGAALGVAVLMKLLPAALFPAIWRRPALMLRVANWTTPLLAALVVLAGYAAYSAAGWRVFGYLSGYAQEEELDGSGGFLLLRLLSLAGKLPHGVGVAYAVVALLLLAALALWIMRTPLPGDPRARAIVIVRDALILSAALIAVLSPHYPWYLTMLVLPAIVFPFASVLWPTLAAPLLYLDFARGQVLWPAIVFLPALPLLAFDLLAWRTMLKEAPDARHRA